MLSSNNKRSSNPLTAIQAKVADLLPPWHDAHPIEEKCTQTNYYDDDEEIDVDYLAAKEGLRIIFPKV